jgi:nitroreductase
MDFFEVITNRYSVRAYKPDPVEDDKLRRILDAAQVAPTAVNRQPFQLIVIHTQGKEAELRRIYKHEWFTQAPVIICICGVKSEAWTRWDGRNYCDVDVAIAMDHLILAAVNEGLSTCWVGAFDEQAAREVLGIPPEVEPLAFTPVGFAADQPRERTRKALADLVRFERW